MKAKLPLHVRTCACDACHPVIDRDTNAARNLAALAAAAVTGTGVAGDQDTPSGCRSFAEPTRRPAPPPPPQGGGGAGRWRNPAAPAAGGDERPYSSRAPDALAMRRTFRAEMLGMLRPDYGLGNGMWRSLPARSARKPRGKRR
ncbi:hypothetical protein ACFC00_42595 [Streptomyces adustus]|uniref:hypothetical protein n=1 Tax=Streptomyces adustus TaxID=1609272 RepID=UPI0035DD1575